MLAICSQKMVSIPHTAEPGPVRARQTADELEVLAWAGNAQTYRLAPHVSCQREAMRGLIRSTEAIQRRGAD
jgi:hypothetical protein